jgi:chromosome partitioning protein
VRTIVLASRKGGAGKTTLAAHLAVEAIRATGGKVFVVDADPMAGLSVWWNSRKADTPRFCKLENGIAAVLAHLEEVGADLVVVDTPPAASDEIEDIIKAADLVVIPVIPSPNDLAAIGETLSMVERVGRPFLFVLNNASTSQSLPSEVAMSSCTHARICDRA